MANSSLAAARAAKFSELEAERILELAASFGLQMRTSPHQFTHIPISLLPSPVPEREFRRAVTSMPLFNRLIDAVARDRTWLHGSLQGLDDFTTRLVQVAKECGEPRQKLYLGIHRSDYMLDAAVGKLLQVEINTIAASFGALASTLWSLHSHILEEYKDRFPDACLSRLPPNAALKSISAALSRAQQLSGIPGVILMIISPGEKNLFDQQKIEIRLWKQFQVRTVRATLSDVHSYFEVDPDTGLGRYADTPVSVIYFRAGYAPNDYPEAEHWEARVKLERSTAIKCPCIDYHLAGVKKVQQLLCKDEHLSRFVKIEAERQQLKDFFTGIFGLEEPLHQEIIDAVRREPKKWVLKPMREGGGNNLYDAELVSAFANYERDPAALKGFILMQKIVPDPLPILTVRSGHVTSALGQWELGIYGTFLSDGTTEFLNLSAGHLLRTKSVDSNEGGVAAGFAVVDTPYLVSE